MTRRAPGAVLIAVLLAAGAARAEDRMATMFVLQIQPLFERHCVECHNGDKHKGGLDLSTGGAMFRGGDSGAAIVPGNARASLLYGMVTHDEQPAMPYKRDKLPRELIASLREWIDAAAPMGKPTSGSAPAALATTGARSGDSVATPPLAPTPAAAASTAPASGASVAALLEKNCFTCHGGKLRQAGLSMATREDLLRGSDGGPVVVPGDPKASLLVKKIRHEHAPGMPHEKDKLSDAVIVRLVDWVKAGVPYERALRMPDAGLQAAAHPRSEHWAFKPPKRPALPAIKNHGWARNPIDAFVGAEHDRRGLTPVGEADRPTLLRRVYLDLIGLPPTTDELRAFLADRSANAYEKVVDRLLASPRHGERWGRHWMDVWRYSDAYGSGDQVRNSHRAIWRWRDWIIDSLNQDKGYDRMLMEMLAADELAPADPKALRATGYLARNWFRYNRNVTMQDTVEHTAAGFLGLTLKCARCHDHKYDPISQEDYYRFRAFFELHDTRLDRMPQSRGSDTNLARIFDAEPREAINPTESNAQPAIFGQTFRFIRGDERNPDRDHPLGPEVPDMFVRQPMQIQPVSLPLEAYYPSFQPAVRQDIAAEAREAVQKAEERLAKLNLAVARARSRVVAHPEEGEPAPGTTPGKPSLAFEKDIKPLLEKSCGGCHGPEDGKSGFDLSSEESIAEGGLQNGPVVFPGNSRDSVLVRYLHRHKKAVIPAKNPVVPDEDVKKIAAWIDEQPEPDPASALRKAEAAVAVAEKALVAARADVIALDARIAAEAVKYANAPGSNQDELGASARKAERQALLLHAEESLLRAQQKLAEALRLAVADKKDEKAREERVEAAQKEVERALARFKQKTETYSPLGPIYPQKSSGRRLALARWVGSRDNPLTARVAVNHIWLRHFGKALVPTVGNFGKNGRPPTHPELLDWLAAELMDRGWSMKTLHRLMVTSSAYRMRSDGGEAADRNLAADAENRYLWHMNPRRLEAEVVRDSLLYLAGKLDLSPGGPSLDPEKGDVERRRSLYFKTTPDIQMTFLSLFDAADPRDCYERSASIMPQQALALSNSSLSRTVAADLARRLGERSTAAAFVDGAFEAVLGYRPSVEEKAEASRFLAQQADLLRAPEKLTTFPAKERPAGAVARAAAIEPERRAREDLIHVLMNHNEFVVIR